MRNFALVTNVHKDLHLELTTKIVDYIIEKGGTAVILCDDSDDPEEYGEIDFSRMQKDTECIIVLGGDGTLIRLASQAMQFHIPLIGVNLGTLGYLCELEENDVFAAIDQLMDGSYYVENRIMVEGSNDAGKTSFGLNDIVIHRAGNLSILRLNVYVNGEYLATYDADGIIVSTPTGSTGYNLSAGGPIVNPLAHMLVLTPINAHSLNARSIVFSSNDVIEIEMGSRRFLKDEVAHISCDGDKVGEMYVGEKYVVSRSQNVVSFIRLNKTSFLEILSKKMGTC